MGWPPHIITSHDAIPGLLTAIEPYFGTPLFQEELRNLRSLWHKSPIFVHPNPRGTMKWQVSFAKEPCFGTILSQEEISGRFCTGAQIFEYLWVQLNLQVLSR